MDTRTILVAAACLVALALAAAGPVAVADGDRPGAGASQEVNVTTVEAVPLGSTTAALVGRVDGVDENTSVVVWFEYRRLGPNEGWQETARKNRTGPGTFHVNVTGLEPATGYEVRAWAAVYPDVNVSGEVRQFETPPRGTDAGGLPRTPTPTRTPTPDPCPEYRGVSGLCSPTPTPTPHDVPSPTEENDPIETDLPVGTPTPDDWLAGLAPLVAWVAAVAVAGPLVLGGLLWLDSLRDDG